VRITEEITREIGNMGYQSARFFAEFHQKVKNKKGKHYYE
jgi:hypothetical protein